MTQLPLPLDPLARYDREPVGQDAPLTAHEFAALEHHGYRFVEAHDAEELWVAATTLDTPDGRQCRDNDWWRSEIDVLFFIARNAAGGDAAPDLSERDSPG